MRGASTKNPNQWHAGTASALLPGLGQLSVGRKRIGWSLVVASLFAVVALIALVVVNGSTEVAAWLVDPDILMAILLVNLVVLVVRLWSTASAWRSAGGVIGIGLSALLVVVTIPHVAVGYVVSESRSALEEIFVTEPVAALVTTTTTSTPTTSTSLIGDPLVPANPIPFSLTTTTTTLPLETERLTVLLLGGDAGPDRTGLRTDTMIVATIDTLTGEAVMFGLPRSMGGFEFSDGQVFPGAGQGLLNEVYRYGGWYPERFVGIDPGAIAVMDVASHLLDIPIDYFVLVDLVGFAELVDAFGGVDVYVPRRIPAPIYNRETGARTNLTLEPGHQHMDGDIALAFARSRTGTTDYDRMGRQRCLLAAFAEQINPVTVFSNFGPILASMRENLTTDIPIEQLPALVKLAPIVSMENTLVVGFDLGYRQGFTANGLAKPNVEKIRNAVALAIADPERARIELGIPPASEICEEHQVE